MQIKLVLSLSLHIYILYVCTSFHIAPLFPSPLPPKITEHAGPNQDHNPASASPRTPSGRLWTRRPQVKVGQASAAAFLASYTALSRTCRAPHLPRTHLGPMTRSRFQRYSTKDEWVIKSSRKKKLNTNKNLERRSLQLVADQFAARPKF